MRPRLLLVLPKTSYRGDAFLDAARAAGADVCVASDRCHQLDGHYEFPAGSFVIDLLHPDEAATAIARDARERPVVAVLGAGGEAAAYVAALASRLLGLPANPPEAALAAGDKLLLRTRLATASVSQPRFAVATEHESSAVIAARVTAGPGFPCVVKPRFLSGSRGVMRADDEVELAARLARLWRLLAIPELRAHGGDAAQSVLVEEFVPGAEVAFEGLLDHGALRTLALFDKPDPLDGPFFEESLYITPSRLADDEQARIAHVVAEAAHALGLIDGPIHAELRLGANGPVVLEVAARSIGGLCSRALRFGTGLSLEELLVRHALGHDIATHTRERSAAGAMMLPIPAAGVLDEVTGVAAALALPGIEDVVITLPLGHRVVPLPEGSSYLGFVFARGETPAAVEASLRAAHRALGFRITPRLATTD